MPTKTFKVSTLVDHLSIAIGNTGARDMILVWLENVLGNVLNLDWPWNWTNREMHLPLHVSEPDTTLFTWVAGTNYIDASAPLVNLNTSHTGRKVQINDHWFRIVDVSHLTANRIVLEGFLEEDETTGITLSFVRDEVMLQTSRIARIRSKQYRKIEHVSEQDDSFYGNSGTFDERRVDTGEVLQYTELDSLEIPRPRYRPKVAGTSVGTFLDGVYYYYYTRFDPETGLESAPGPVLEYTHAVGALLIPNIAYDNLASGVDAGEENSYWMRLYRSKKDPTRERTPMYLIQTRAPTLAAGPYLDSAIGDMFQYERYWSGPQTTLYFMPIPDSKHRRMTAKSVRSYGVVPDLEDIVRMGNYDELFKLMVIYMSGMMSSTNRNAKERRDAFIQFKSQLNYELNKARTSAEFDKGRENYISITPGLEQQNSGDAFENSLQSGGPWVNYRGWN